MKGSTKTFLLTQEYAKIRIINLLSNRSSLSDLKHIDIITVIIDDKVGQKGIFDGKVQQTSRDREKERDRSTFTRYVP